MLLLSGAAGINNTFKYCLQHISIMKNLRWLLDRTGPDSMDSLGGKKQAGGNALRKGGNFFRMIKKHKSSERRNFISDEQIQEIVARARLDGHKNPEKLFNDIKFRWSAYVLKIACDDPGRIVALKHTDGSKYIGFYHINPDGSAGGFVSAYCHFHPRESPS